MNQYPDYLVNGSLDVLVVKNALKSHPLLRCRPESQKTRGSRRASVRVPQRGTNCVPRQVELARPAFFDWRKGSSLRSKEPARRGGISLVTFFGRAKKVTRRRAAPGEFVDGIAALR